MKHKPYVGEQLALFAIAPTVETRITVHDPYWDELDTRQNSHSVGGQNLESGFPYKSVGEQVTTDTQKSAPQHDEPQTRWNPADFGEVPHKVADDGQLTIFYDDSDEPPDPDDYQNVNDYHQAWAEWRTLVGGQVTTSTIDNPVKTRVGGQVTLTTKKSAHQHDTHWLEKYWVQRGNIKYWYYRYCWREGRKKQRVYIGSVDSILAKRKKASVESAIADGKLALEIKQLIRGWKHEPSTMPKM